MDMAVSMGVPVVVARVAVAVAVIVVVVSCRHAPIGHLPRRRRGRRARRVAGSAAAPALMGQGASRRIAQFAVPAFGKNSCSPWTL